MTGRLQYLREVLITFLRLGCIGFGGPAAVIAMMEEEYVERRQWLTREHFLDLLGLTNLMPGPNSTQMAMHLGLIRAGWLGFLLAGLGFIIPAAIISLIFALIYVHAGTIGNLEPLLLGIRPVVLGIIIVSIWRLGKAATKTYRILPIGLLVMALAFLGIGQITAMFLGAIVGMFWLQLGNRDEQGASALVLTGQAGLTNGANKAVLTTTATLGGLAAGAASISSWQIGLFFLKIGAVLFGGGYVLIAFLEGGLVRQYGWLTHDQLLDAIAVGQFTPGPLLSTATFIGYLLDGTWGAIVATAAIFLPSFFFVAASQPLVHRVRQWSWTAAFLDAINISAIALMVLVAVNLGRQTLTNWTSWFLFLPATFIYLRWKINPAWLVLGGAVAGWLVFR